MTVEPFGWDYFGGDSLLEGGGADIPDVPTVGDRALVPPIALVTTPQLAFPLRFQGAAFAVVEQDTEEEIRASVETIVRYPIGTRPELPDFGVPDHTFQQGTQIDLAPILAAVARWEPRAATLAQTLSITPDQLVRQVVLSVQGGQ